MNTVPTDRDQLLFEALTRHVRVMTFGQATRLMQHCSAEPAPTGRTVRHRLERLMRAGWLEIHEVNAHRVEPVDRPLAKWSPGKRVPNPESIAEKTMNRWSDPRVVLTVCVASPRTANVLGSSAHGLPRLVQLDHDLLLSSVYLHYRLSGTCQRESWLGEHCLPKAGYRIKDPDAFLIDARGRVTRVVESAGKYSVKQIESLHEYCCDRGYRYELW